MKLVLDTTVCQGYGLCQMAAPDLVDLDDSGYAELIGDGTVHAAEANHAHDAVSSCPARAPNSDSFDLSRHGRVRFSGAPTSVPSR